MELSPEFGFAWARMAELEFSFGRTPQAIEDVKHALALAPRDAQAHSLEGFLLAAQNRIAFARRSFEQAIALDGALGNAWLGRGLCFIRGGYAAEGQRDLQTAAVLEPNRSILRSYLGKAFSQVGNAPKAHSEFQRAKDLDPNDPTPWLYSAIQNKQENRYNQAIDDLEKSIELNDNRRVYRSQFLLDQDRTVRGTNLAAIYLNDGLTDQSVREAVRAVNGDYSSASAHLFLANSYNALRDPNRILLRYETGWFNELLLSNLLSPVGGGPLSQFVSQQEYSKLFESDGLGISSATDYFSYGELRETASQYGTFGNISYALDAEYQYNNGLRPNNAISRFESYASFKLQLGPQDTLFFQTKFEDLETGDLLQRYDQGEVGRETTTEVPDANGKLHKVVTKNVAALTTDFRETQDPALILAGWHHEWSPGNHTLLLVGQLANDQVLTADDTNQIILTRDVALLAPQGLLSQINDLNKDRPLTNRDVYTALRSLTGRGRITAISGASFDENIRLEPTQVAGFTQAYRTLLSESLLGSVAGSEFKFWGVSLEQKLLSRTYFGAEFNVLEQDFDRTIGVFDFLDSGGNLPPAVLPSSLPVQDSYREDILTLTLNQLVGDRWSFGTRYRYTRSHFTEQLGSLRDALATAAPGALTDLAHDAEMRRESGLNELSLYRFTTIRAASSREWRRTGSANRMTR